MAGEPSHSQSDQIANAWSQFAKREEGLYPPEDHRLCALKELSIPEVIERFMDQGTTRLSRPIPHQRRILREFLGEVASKLPGGYARFIDIDVRHFNTTIAALLEDRHDHSRCADLVDKACIDDVVYSQNLSASKLFENLHQKVAVPPQDTSIRRDTHNISANRPRWSWCRKTSDVRGISDDIK